MSGDSVPIPENRIGLAISKTRQPDFNITYLRHKLSPYGVNIVHEAGSVYILQVSPPTKVERAD